MIFLKTHLHTILLIALGVFITLTIKSCTDKAKRTDRMIEDAVKVKYLEEDRLKDSVRHVIELAAKDSVIASLKQQFAATTPQLQQSKKDYEKIRPVINGLSNNELLQRANSFVPK